MSTGALLPSFKTRVATVYGLVTLLNLAAWFWSVIAFRTHPDLFAIALITYGLGLRHAVDADHIAAIDNVTRKLVQQGQRPAGVGFSFAIGHSIVITIVAAAVASATEWLVRFEDFRNLGSLVSTGASMFFLLAIAAMNIAIFISIFRTWRQVQEGGTFVEEALNALLNGRGILSRIFRPMFRLVTKNWHMLVLGFLFGLGFDTATEVAMFGVSATQMAKGVSFSTLLAFPLLFAAGMSLVDTTDGVLMVGAYEWAFVQPTRKLVYNMTITLVSALVAVFVGGTEALGLLRNAFQGTGGFWHAVAELNDNFNALGFIIIAVFGLGWVISYGVYRGTRSSPVALASGS